MKLIVSQAATADLARLHAFLVDKNPAAADRAVAALVAAIQSISAFPKRGRPSGTPNIRELIVPFGGAGYVVRYSHSEQADEAAVLRITHGREARE